MSTIYSKTVKQKVQPHWGLGGWGGCRREEKPGRQMQRVIEKPRKNHPHTYTEPRCICRATKVHRFHHHGPLIVEDGESIAGHSWGRQWLQHEAADAGHHLQGWGLGAAAASQGLDGGGRHGRHILAIELQQLVSRHQAGLTGHAIRLHRHHVGWALPIDFKPIRLGPLVGVVALEKLAQWHW